MNISPFYEEKITKMRIWVSISEKIHNDILSEFGSSEDALDIAIQNLIIERLKIMIDEMNLKARG